MVEAVVVLQVVEEVVHQVQLQMEEAELHPV
jgi:hypothetical protein